MIDTKILHKYLLDNPFIGISVVDANEIGVLVNDAQVRISGIPKEEFVGKDIKMMVKKKHLSISSTAEVLKRKEEVDLHQTNSRGKSYDLKAVPIFDEDGTIKYVISYLLDITQLQHFKEMVVQLEVDNKKNAKKLEELLNAHGSMGKLVYCSKKMENIVELARKVASSDATVLIVGPSGSGKELIADMIHENGKRKDAPFIKINCASIPEHLLESELFGYEAGTFTGGNPKGRKGILELADGGSLLLDEIGEMSMSLQAKLLRILQGQEVRRLGGNKTLTLNVRIIASTNAPLKEMIEEKRFREDLYYRLNVIEIKVPTLGERKDDIPMLIGRFVNEFNIKYENSKRLSTDTLNYLMVREYPGNVRELKNTIERLLLQSPNDEVSLTDAVEICNDSQIMDKMLISFFRFEETEKQSLKDMMEIYEKALLKEHIRVYKKTETIASKLKIDRSTLSRKMQKYDL